MTAGAAKGSPDSRRTVAPAAAARAAGLRYVHDGAPGLGRRRRGRGMAVVDAGGRPVRDPVTIDRVRRLAIPPAWTDVWICPREDGHLQATGRDARGRKQYRYHLRWREVRDGTKFDRLAAFGRALPRLRARVKADLARPGLPRSKVLAAVVGLLDKTLIRVGNEEYARGNRSYGLTTLKDGHVKVAAGRVRLAFRGKSGVRHRIDLEDARLARVVRRCQDLPGQELFQYEDDDGGRRVVDSADVNDYLRAAAGEEFTSKDFRTWAGTVLAAALLGRCRTDLPAARAKREVTAVIEAVARKLGNTPRVCRTCYVHPAVIDAYLQGALADLHTGGKARSGLRREETAVLKLLQGKVAN